MTTQAHIFYSGTVQGVGFRYTVQGLAIRLELTGWVKNLSDGRVEILAEGPEADIQQLLDRLSSHFEGYIRDCRVDYQAASGEFKDFQVTF